MLATDIAIHDFPTSTESGTHSRRLRECGLGLPGRRARGEARGNFFWQPQVAAEQVMVPSIVSFHRQLTKQEMQGNSNEYLTAYALRQCPSNLLLTTSPSRAGCGARPPLRSGCMVEVARRLLRRRPL